MPCTDGGRQSYDDDPETIARLDKVTRLLCSVMQHTSDKTIAKTEYPIELQQWWSDHQAEDKRRERFEKEQLEKENKKKKALNKLSNEEKKLLGLK